MTLESSSLEIERGSERNFGVTFSIVFTLIGIYWFWKSESILWWTFASAVVLLVISYTVPGVLKLPNYWWSKLGMILGKIIAPIVMALVYLVTFVPMGLYVRLTGKDLLHIKLDRDADSYWIRRDTPPQPMKNQF